MRNVTTEPFAAHDLRGCIVEKVIADESPLRAAYKVTTPRRKVFWLHRNQPNPHMLFPIADQGLVVNPKIGGYAWFSDRDGRLRPTR